ncbi:VOC family protein, partial [candidate division WOR-3 bacterium]|nr:VOC family protein [candidate division WOR-3 bacterium]
MFKGVQTLAVYATDMAQSRQFYTEVLGFKVRAEVHPGLCFLSSPNGKIDIYLEAGMKPAAV